MRKLCLDTDFLVALLRAEKERLILQSKLMQLDKEIRAAQMAGQPERVEMLMRER